MKRTQLYLDDELVATLRLRSRQSGKTISELVREALRERYSGDRERRRQAMLGLVGLWRNRTDIGDTEAYIRKLRSGSRLRRLYPDAGSD